MKIRWQQSERNTNVIEGYLGRWQCARVLITRSDKLPPFHWRCYLPVHEPVGYGDTLDDAKAQAAQYVEEFITRAGLEQRA